MAIETLMLLMRLGLVRLVGMTLSGSEVYELTHSGRVLAARTK